MNIRIILGSFVVITFLAAALAYTQFTKPARGPNAESLITITHEIEGILPAHTIAIERGKNALEVLREETRTRGIALKEKEYAGLGSMVEQIGEYENGTDGKYWTYTINAIDAAVGAGTYIVEPNDTIQWSFSVPEGY